MDYAYIDTKKKMHTLYIAMDPKTTQFLHNIAWNAHLINLYFMN